jgi:hypothetical protein
VTQTSNGFAATDARSAALHYRVDRSWFPVPVPARRKGPVIPGWQKLRLDVEGVLQHFPGGAPMNVGVLTGLDSKLLDADLDCRAAVQAAPAILPPTGLVSGRPSNPCSHWWYSTLARQTSLEFKNPAGRKMVELRGEDHQTLLPPSWHDTDPEQYRWESYGEPAEVPVAVLVQRIKELACICLLEEIWPRQRGRHDLFLPLCGGLAHGTYDVAGAERIVRGLVAATGDGELADRLRELRDSYRRREAGENVVGWPTLADLLGEQGEASVGQLRGWLGLAMKVRAPGSATPPRYRPLPPYRPFPLAALPPVVSDLATAAAGAIGCDVALVALPALVAAAGAVGNSRAVLLKASWSEPVNLWGVTIVASGKLKSPASEKAVSPLLAIQAALHAERRARMEEYRAAMRAWRSEPRADRGEEPEEPPPAVVHVTSNVTIEKVGINLQNNPRGLVVYRDELDAWFRSYAKYRGTGGGNDRADWLELHRAGTLLVERVGRETISVHRALVSVYGTIQPLTFSRVMDADALQAGLGARFLVQMPPSPPRRWTEADIPEDVRGRYDGLLHDLLALRLEDEAARRPYFLRLDPDAKRAWVRWFDEWGRVQEDSEGEQAAALAKLEAYGARLALLHHVVSLVAAGESDRVPISEASVRAGITLARWFAHEADRVYLMLAESDEQRVARGLVELIQRRGGGITVRHLMLANRRRYPDADAAQAALDGLVSAGLARWVEQPTTDQGGRPTRICELRITHHTTHTTPSPWEEEDSEAATPAGHTTAHTTPPPPDFPSETEGCVSSVMRDAQENVLCEGASGPREPTPAAGEVVCAAGEVVCAAEEVVSPEGRVAPPGEQGGGGGGDGDDWEEF